MTPLPPRSEEVSVTSWTWSGDGDQEGRSGKVGTEFKWGFRRVQDPVRVVGGRRTLVTYTNPEGPSIVSGHSPHVPCRPHPHGVLGTPPPRVWSVPSREGSLEAVHSPRVSGFARWDVGVQEERHLRTTRLVPAPPGPCRRPASDSEDPTGWTGKRRHTQGTPKGLSSSSSLGKSRDPGLHVSVPPSPGGRTEKTEDHRRPRGTEHRCNDDRDGDRSVTTEGTRTESKGTGTSLWVVF